MPDRAAVKAYLLDLQARIVSALEQFDGKPFVTDSWDRPAGGGGLTRLIEELLRTGRLQLLPRDGRRPAPLRNCRPSGACWPQL
jgi:hypothetical protein